MELGTSIFGSPLGCRCNPPKAHACRGLSRRPRTRNSLPSKIPSSGPGRDGYLPLRRMVSDGYVGSGGFGVSSKADGALGDGRGKIYKRLDSCLVIPPPGGRKPRAIVKFLGGAFIGAVPEVTYSYLIELLAKEGFLIIAVPYNVTFDHARAASEVYEKFHCCLDNVLTSGLPDDKLSAADLVDLPLFSVGHSNGALLQVLAGSYFSEKIPK